MVTCWKMAGATLLLLALIASGLALQCDVMSPIVIGKGGCRVIADLLIRCAHALYTRPTSPFCTHTHTHTHTPLLPPSVPGILGSQMEGKLAKANHTPHWYCPKDKDWYTFWLNIEQLLPGLVDCFSDNVM